MADSDCHWVAEGSVGESQCCEWRIAHSIGTYVLHRDPRVVFCCHTFLKMVNTVKSDELRISSGRAVLRLAFRRRARANRLVFDVVVATDVDFRTKLLLAWKVREMAFSFDIC
jgi:hypothetical protein